MAQSGADLIALLEQTSKGDRKAFAALYDATNMKLFGIVLRILRKQEIAEEILQEVYVKIWHRSGDFRAERGSPITWMATIARNHSLDEVRKRAPAFVDEPDAVEKVADPCRTPEGKVEASEEMNRLEICLAQLEEQKREAVMLAYLDGYSRKELAEHLGQPVNTIKTWLHRSLKNLKDCLGN